MKRSRIFKWSTAAVSGTAHCAARDRFPAAVLQAVVSHAAGTFYRSGWPLLLHCSLTATCRFCCTITEEQPWGRLRTFLK